MTKEALPKLVGSWKLVSFNIQDSSGQTAYPFGKDAQGRLIYEPDRVWPYNSWTPTVPVFRQVIPL